MSVVKCPCGEYVADTSWPHPSIADLVTQRGSDVPPGERPASRQVMECAECGRLMVQARPRSEEYLVFYPEGAPLRMRRDP